MRPSSGIDLNNVADPVLIATVGRSGTHLMIDTLRYQFADFDIKKRPVERLAAVFVPLDQVAVREYSARAARRTIHNAPRAIGRTHDWPQVFEKLEMVDIAMAALFRERASIVQVVRNPLIAFPKLWALFAQIFDWEKGCGGNEAWLADMARKWAEQVLRLARAPRHLLVRLEDMLETPAREIGRLGVFLGAVPRMREPLVIPPNRNRFESGLARLSARPRSTHALLRARVRADFPMAWTAERLAILDEYAGDAMEAVGYDRPCAPPTGCK